MPFSQVYIWLKFSPHFVLFVLYLRWWVFLSMGMQHFLDRGWCTRRFIWVHCRNIQHMEPFILLSTTRSVACFIPKILKIIWTVLYKSIVYSRNVPYHPPPHWKFQSSLTHFFQFFGLIKPPTPPLGNFNPPSGGEYGYCSATTHTLPMHSPLSLSLISRLASQLIQELLVLHLTVLMLPRFVVLSSYFRHHICAGLQCKLVEAW